MNEKVKLTKEQSEVLEDLKVNYPAKAIIQNVIREEYSAEHVLYQIEIDTLIRALYIGYEVEQTVEEQLLSNFESVSMDNGYGQGWKAGYRTALDIIGMKVKGINEFDF